MTNETRAQLLKDMLMHVKLKTSEKNSSIAGKLNCSSGYLSKMLTEGVPEVFLNKFTAVFADQLADFGKNKYKISKPDLTDQALLKALLNDYIKLKAMITKMKVEDIADELDQSTKLILRDMMK